jgi:hypothetical protein
MARMRRKFRTLRPMSAFDPEMRAFVHDTLNDRELVWKPEWASRYQQWAFVQPDGNVEWDGLILDGWRPFVVRVAG